MSVAVTHSLMLRLVGRPAVMAEGRSLALPEKAYALLALLATARGLRLEREVLRNLLWSADLPKQRAGSLRQLLARIDKSLPEPLPRLIKADNTHVVLDTAAWQVDLLDLAREEEPGEDYDVDLLFGELLQGVRPPTPEIEEWLTLERQRVAALQRPHLERLLAEERLEQERALKLAQAMIEAEPGAESGDRALMRLHAGAGNISAARQAFFRCRARLRSEFGAEPEAETLLLARELGILQIADTAPAAAVPASPPLPDRSHSGQPRVLILPPETMLSDPLLERVGRVLLEDVTIGLSQQRGFKIIAAHTSIELLARRAALNPGHGQPPPLDELAVDYTVYVTIQGSSDEVIATCRLTRNASGEVLWAIDLPLMLGKMSHSFANLSRRIVATLVDTIERRELNEAMDDTNPSAFRLYLEGKRLVSKTDLQHLRQARKWFRASLSRNDGFAPAHAGLARTLGMEWLVRGMRDTDLLDQANRAAWAARDADTTSGRALRELGFVALYRRRFEESLGFFAEAEMLSPNDADILADYADALLHDGQSDLALEKSLAAIRLNPLPPDYYYWNLGGIYFVREEYDKAIEALDRVKDRPATARLLAAVHAKAGNMDKARHYAAVVLDLYPDFRTEDIWHIVPDRRSEDTRQLIEALRKAGLP